MPIMPKEIEDMIQKIKPWLIGIQKFKEDTPDEIILMNDHVMAWFREVSDGVQ